MDRGTPWQSFAKDAADLGLSHMFYDNSRKSRYDPIAENITKGGELVPAGLGNKDAERKWRAESEKYSDKYVDTNGSEPMVVKNVLLLGSNHLLFETPKAYLGEVPKGGSILDAPILFPKEAELADAPEDSEIIAFAATLKAKAVFDKHGIPATIFYMPTDLPKADVPDLSEIREEYKKNKFIDPIMHKLAGYYGFSDLPVISNTEISDQELKKDPTLKGKILSGRHIWNALESEFRSGAGHTLERIVKGGAAWFEKVTEEFYPGGYDAWMGRNYEHGLKWGLLERDDGYYIAVRKTDKKNVGFTIHIGGKARKQDGTATAGAPKCALIGMTMMQRFAKLGFSHVFAAFHSEEVPIAHNGFFLANSLLGIPVSVYITSINRRNMTAGYCINYPYPLNPADPYYPYSFETYLSYHSPSE